MASLTYVYADSTAVLGPLSSIRVPGAFDLCTQHAARTSVPRGWEVIRLPLDGPAERAEAPGDDLLALADAVREIGLRHDDIPPAAPVLTEPEPAAVRQMGHLRLLPGLD